jgi:hypothetical protein
MELPFPAQPVSSSSQDRARIAPVDAAAKDAAEEKALGDEFVCFMFSPILCFSVPYFNSSCKAV